MIKDLLTCLDLIAEGSPYKVEHLYEDRYIILVDNDNFMPDNGADPYVAFEFEAKETK